MRSPLSVRRLFLGRASFRLRRLRDASRMLPVVALLLLMLPLLKGGAEDARTSGVLLYLFGLWAMLVLFSAILSVQIIGTDDDRSGSGSDGGGARDPGADPGA